MNSRARCVLVALFAIACADPERVEDTAPVERMVDGITHVHNASLAADTLSWRIDPTPVLTIGVAEGPEEYLIGRLAGYLRLRDGTILVGDAIASTVRLYDGNGRFLKNIGRAGDGPGEYRVLANILPHADDSVIVVDYEGGRATVLDSALTFVRSFMLGLQKEEPQSVRRGDGLAGSFGNGSLLMYDYQSTCGRSRSDGFCEDSVDLYATDLSGQPKARYGRFVHARQQSYHVAGNLSTSWGEPHPQAFWRATSGRAVYGDAKRFRFLLFDETGIQRIVTAPHDARRYTRDELWPPIRNSANGDARGQAATRVMNEARETAELPDSLPQFSDILLDETGHVWVRRFMVPGSSRHEPEWLVFDSRGHLQYAVRSAPGMLRMVMSWQRTHPQVGEDFVLTSLRDVDGVESVVMYRLLKSP